VTDPIVSALIVDLAQVVRAVTPEQEKLPTPCPAWDVLSLRRHLLGWLHLFHDALTDPAAEQRSDPADHPGPEETQAAAAEIERLATTVQTALAAGFESATVNVPQLGGAYPGAVVLDLLICEILGHGWDLSRATSRPWQPDPAACERALVTLAGLVQPEYRGPEMPFGPEVSVADNAPALDRFVAFTGRDPQWDPAQAARV
jgi:uncharacterized protein (TIGR03086 family)